MSGLVQTVLGPLAPSKLGAVLAHEHLSSDITQVFIQPVPKPFVAEQAHCEYTLRNSGWIQQFPYSHVKNMSLNDAESREAILEDVKTFKSCGGGTIVECSVVGVNRDIHFVKELSQKTGVNVVAGTGYYVACSQTENTLKLSSEEMEKAMLQDLLTGVDGTDIRCGLIGEIGCSWPLEPFEKKVLSAVASVQQNLKCPVSIHPGRSNESPFEIMRVLLEKGGKADKTVMGHLERTIFDDGQLAEFGSLGTYMEFDLFGIELSYYQMNPKVDMPSDAQRITRLKKLVDEGYEDRIVIGHDIHTKHRLKHFGGHGYAHILINAVPKMKLRGFSDDVIEKIMCDNPQIWLAWV